MNVLFTEKQKKYIANMVESGDFQNASEVVRDALRLHEIMRKRLIDDLRKEIEIGLNSGVSERTGAQILADKRKQYGIQ
jgi:antitoxin ParD1/3/4